MADIKKFQFILDGKIANNFKSELNKIGGTISGLNDTQVVVDFDENATMANFKKLYQKLEKENSDLTVQFRYDINKLMLENAQKELSQLEMYVDIDKANKEILELVKGLKDINLKLEVEGITESEEDKLFKQSEEIANKIGKIISTHISIDGSTKIFDNLSDEAKTIIESFTSLSKIKEIKPFDTKNIEKQRLNVENIKTVMSELESKGAAPLGGSGSIDNSKIEELQKEIFEVKEDISSLKGRVDTLEDTTAFDTLSSKANDFDKEIKDINNSVVDLQKVLTPLFNGINQIYKENNGNHISGYWSKLKEEIEGSNTELKELLKSVGLYDSKSNSLKLISDGMVNSGGLIGDDRVLIARKNKNDRLEQTQALKIALDKAHASGINVARILDIIGTKESDVFLELQETANGNVLGNIYGQLDEDFVNTEWLEATDEQIKKLISDLITLQKMGINVESNLTNIMYDKKSGFSFIDMDLDITKFENDAELMEDHMIRIFGDLEDFYLDKNDTTNANIIAKARERFENLSKQVQQSYAEAQDSHSPSKEFEKLENDAVDGVVEGANKNEDRLKNVGKQMADNIKDGFKEGMSEIGTTALSPENQSTVLSGDQSSVLSGNQTPLSLIEESSGQLAMFEGVEEQQKEVKTAIEKTNDAIEGQIDLFDYLSKQEITSDKTNISSENNIVDKTDKKDIDEVTKSYLNLSEVLKDLQSLVSSSKVGSSNQIKSVNEKYGGLFGDNDSFEKQVRSLKLVLQTIEEINKSGSHTLGNYSAISGKSDIEFFEKYSQIFDTLGYKLETIPSDGGLKGIVTASKDAVVNLDDVFDRIFRIKELSTSSTPIKDTFDATHTTTFSDIKEETVAIEENTQALKENQKTQENQSKSKSKNKEVVTNPSKEGFKVPTGWVKDINKAWDDANSENAIKNYQELINKVERYYSLLAKKDKLVDGSEEKAEFELLQKQIENATKSIDEFNGKGKEFNNVVKQFKTRISEFNKKSGQTGLSSRTNTFDELSQDDIVSSKLEEKYKPKLEELENILLRIKTLVPIDVNSEEDREELNRLNAEFDKLANNLKSDEYNPASKIDIDNLSGKISDTLHKNTAAPKEIRMQLEGLINDLKRLGLSEADIDKVRASFVSLNSQMKATGKTGDSLGTKITKKFKDVAAYFATYVSIQDAIQVIRQGFETIKEYDTALTEMNKVSDESIQTLKEFQEESFGSADAIGTTASALQNSTADWMRLGESLEEAKQSAQDANILFNVSEFETIDEATDSLVSMSQAFKDLEKGEIIDVVNNLGNNFAISTDGLATALKDSASSLQTAQNDFYESAALVTAANTVVQDPAKVGAGLRTIALRLTGTEAAREELAALGEDVDDFIVTTTSKMDQQIQDLTKTQGNFGVSLLDMNGNYRSTYDVLLDIAKVWDQIAQEDLVTGENRQNALLEMMAGKNRSNILASVLQSPEILEEAYAYALDSEGSAMRENEAYLESIEAHLAQLKNAWDALWINENNREVITFFLDLAKSVLEAVNNFGVLKTLLIGGGGIFAAVKSFQGDGRLKKSSLIFM